jgi:hypothetical protein
MMTSASHVSALQLAWTLFAAGILLLAIGLAPTCSGEGEPGAEYGGRAYVWEAVRLVATG